MTWKKVWSKRFSIRLAENWLYSVEQFPQIFGVKFPDQLIVIKDEMGTGYHDAEQLEKCLQGILRKIYASSFETVYETKALPVLESFRKFCLAIGKRDLEKHSADQFIELWQEFITQEDDWMNYVWAVFSLDEILSRELNKELPKAVTKDKLEQILSAIFSTERKTAAAQQRIDLLNLAARATPENREEGLAQLTNHYAYFPILNMDEDPLSPEYFARELKKIPPEDAKAELKKLATAARQHQKAYKEFLASIENNQKLYRLVDACHRVAFYREYRNDLRQESYYHARALYQEIARRLQLSISGVTYLTRYEVKESLEKENPAISPSLIAERKKFSVLRIEGGQVSYHFDPATADFLPHTEELQGGKNILTGVAAYPGTVRGRVKVVLSVKKDTDKFEPGDILVATTTNLSFMPLISKASAIVTDEGGMLTHTAIVARELKKPCVVGTEVATTCLKDGDEIEVQADKGIVRILG